MFKILLLLVCIVEALVRTSHAAACDQCQQWATREQQAGMEWFLSEVEPLKCPCDPRQAIQRREDGNPTWWTADRCCRPGMTRRDLRRCGGQQCRYNPGATLCIVSRETQGGHAQQCCYDAADGLLPEGHPGAGTADKGSKRPRGGSRRQGTTLHILYDLRPYEWCCSGGCNMCDTYRTYRPNPTSCTKCPHCEMWAEQEAADMDWYIKEVKNISCPCQHTPTPEGWKVDFCCGGSLSFFCPGGNCGFHKEAVKCLRKSTDGGHAQQCCYDATGAVLPPGNESAGTADKVAGTIWIRSGHMAADVIPYDQCCKACDSCGNYTSYRPNPDVPSC